MNNELEVVNQSVATHPMQLIDRALATGASIEQIEKLMDLNDRWEKKIAEKSYNEAMANVQKEIGAVKAKLHNRQTNSKYAGIVDVDAAIRPHYTANGIAISFDTDTSPLPEHVRILAFVTHRDGHKETRHIDIPADGKGAKGGDVMTKTHAVMSATTYGQRALLKMIFNIATGEFDDDGNKAGGKREVRLPVPTAQQWTKIIEKFKTGSADLDTIKKSFSLTDEQNAEIKKLIG